MTEPMSSPLQPGSAKHIVTEYLVSPAVMITPRVDMRMDGKATGFAAFQLVPKPPKHNKDKTDRTDLLGGFKTVKLNADMAIRTTKHAEQQEDSSGQARQNG